MTEGQDHHFFYFVFACIVAVFLEQLFTLKMFMLFQRLNGHLLCHNPKIIHCKGTGFKRCIGLILFPFLEIPYRKYNRPVLQNLLLLWLFQYLYMQQNAPPEVIIVGGSYAGLSAAMALGRSLRQVLIIDNGQPCNAQSPHAHNFLAHDGESPQNIVAKAKKQVAQYATVEFLDDTVIDVSGQNNRFTVITSGGKRFLCKKILFATGVKDLVPAIEGFAECWGISVLHCPYCHGYEVKGKKTAVLANGEMAFHTCMVLTQWTRDLTLYTNGPCTMDAGQTEKLSAHGISMIENEIQSIVHHKGYMKSIHLANGETHDFTVMYAKIAFEQQCKIPVHIGCQTTEEGLIVHDEMKKTCVPGIFAAGDNTSLGRTLSMAIAAGTIAGMSINGEITSDGF